MINIILILLIVYILIFVIIKYYIAIKRDSKSKIEKNMKILYNVYCGNKYESNGLFIHFFFPSFNLIPTRLTVYKEFIVISGINKHEIYNENIREISVSIVESQNRTYHNDLTNSWTRLGVYYYEGLLEKNIFLYTNQYYNNFVNAKKIIENNLLKK